MGSISYETYIQAIGQIHDNPKHLLIRDLHSNGRDSLKTITNLSIKFKSTVSQNYEDAKLLASELKRMGERKVQKELRKNLLIRMICQLFEKFVNWKEKNGWNTNAELALKMSKLFANIPMPAPRVLVQQAPKAEIPQVPHQGKKAEVLEEPVVSAKTEEVKPQEFILPNTSTKQELLPSKNTHEKTPEKTNAQPSILSPTLKAGTIRFNALMKYKNNPQECKPFDKRRIWGDVIGVESKNVMQSSTAKGINNLKDLILFMSESDQVDLSNPVCDPFILDLFTCGKAQLMSDFTSWVVNQKGFNPNLLNSICETLAKHLADKSNYTDAYIIDILLAKVRTFYKDHPQSCTHPAVLLVFKALLKIDSNHGKAVEYIEWLKEVNKIDLDTFKNLMDFFVEKNRDSNFEYPLQNVLLSVYKNSNWKEILDREPSENKKLIDYLNKLENPVPAKPIEEPAKKEEPVFAKPTNVSRPQAERHQRTPTTRRTIARKDSLSAYQFNLLQEQPTQLNNKTKGIVWGDIKSIRKNNEKDSVEALINEMTKSSEIDFSDRPTIRIVRDALSNLNVFLGEELLAWVYSHPTFGKEIFLQCSLHYTSNDWSDKKLTGLFLLMKSYKEKIHETLSLNDKDVVALYSLLLKHASNDPQTQKQLEWIFQQPEFDLVVFKTFINVFYNKQVAAKNNDGSAAIIISSAMGMLVDHLATKTDWESTLQDQKLLKYIHSYRKV